MIKYRLSDIDGNATKTISLIVQDICKENKINYQKQEYKILFSNEKILVKNNEIKFTSGAKKSLSFYGKIYSNKNGNLVETIYLKDEVIQIEPEHNNLLIMCEEIENSTKVDSDQELLYFYVAPNNLLTMQDPSLWQTL